MLKNQFTDQLEFDVYLIEQKSRKEKGYLTVSERKQLESMLSKDYKPILIKEEIQKPYLVTNIKELRISCQEIKKEDNIKEIIEKLRFALDFYSGLGLSANQIGYNQRISYIRIPIYNPTEKKMDLKEMVIINPKIIEKANPIKVQNESCLSFPGVNVTTKRYVYCTTVYLDENLKENTMMFQDLESFTVQHEIDHLNGLTIFNRKWETK